MVSKAFIILITYSDILSTKIFVNLPVKDLGKTVEFFTYLIHSLLMRMQHV